MTASYPDNHERPFLEYDKIKVMNNFVATNVLCHQCGGLLPIETGSQFVTCSFCQATNFVDKGRAVFHYVVRATVSDEAAVAALRRWMAGNATVKDLDKKSQIDRPLFELFPMWLIRVKRDGQEKVLLQPAAALSVSELKHITIPASDLEPYQLEADDVAVKPTVPYETMVRWLADEQQIPAGAIQESSLVHLPIYHCHYQFKGQRYTALVDGASSQVFANIFPAKSEAPYRILGVVAFLIYFCAALLPLIGYLSSDATGLAIGIGAYLCLAAVLAVPIFGMALYISAKI